MAKELVEVCREYCQEVWTEALNLAGIPVALEWWRAKNIYYPTNIRKALVALLGLGVDVASATTVSEQPSTA